MKTMLKHKAFFSLYSSRKRHQNISLFSINIAFVRCIYVMYVCVCVVLYMCQYMYVCVCVVLYMWLYMYVCVCVVLYMCLLYSLTNEISFLTFWYCIVDYRDGRKLFIYIRINISLKPRKCVQSFFLQRVLR